MVPQQERRVNGRGLKLGSARVVLTELPMPYFLFLRHDLIYTVIVGVNGVLMVPLNEARLV